MVATERMSAIDDLTDAERLIVSLQLHCLQTLCGVLIVTGAQALYHALRPFTVRFLAFCYSISLARY